MVHKARGQEYNAMHLRVEKDAFDMLKRQVLIVSGSTHCLCCQQITHLNVRTTHW
jgi:hypothetical protein